MQVKPRRGRTFTASDGICRCAGCSRHQTCAAKFWPREDALGKRLRLVENHTPQPWLTVVGVVPDILQNFRQPLDRDPLIYLPYAEHPEREMFVIARSAD